MDKLQYEFIFRRASYTCYLKFRVNKFELKLLMALVHFLRYKGRNVVARSEFFNHITNNVRERAKMQGYYAGLLDKKIIGTFEYIAIPGSECVGISELGLSVLAELQRELNRLSAQYPIHNHYLDSLPASFTSEPNPKYRLTA